MIQCLTTAGVSEDVAKDTAEKMYAFRKQEATFIEVYGRSVFDQSQVQRRNLNVKGLDSLDLRTVKKNGQPWNFCLRADRKEARELVSKLKPDWIVGAPPCTPFSIWNHGINFKKMDPEVVKKMIEEGQLHLRFMTSLYRHQIKQGR